MEPIKLDCTYEERKSEKTGNIYKAIFIKITPKYEKVVLIKYPEQVLIEQVSETTIKPNEFPL